MSRFVPNPAAHQLLEQAQPMQTHLEDTARTVAGQVRRAGPLGETGNYRRSIRARGTRVVAEDFAWHLVEYGSVKNPPYAPLRRGVRAAGVRLVERPR